MCSPRMSSVVRNPRSLRPATIRSASSTVSPAIYLLATLRTIPLGAAGCVGAVARAIQVPQQQEFTKPLDVGWRRTAIEVEPGSVTDVDVTLGNSDIFDKKLFHRSGTA